MSAVAHIRQYKEGRFFSEEFRGTMSWNGYENNVLLRNDGCRPDGVPRFVDVGMVTGADDQKDSRGVATGDFDHDGDLDLAVNHSAGDHGQPELGRAVLLRNEVGQSRRWIAVELVGTASNRDGVGATVVVETGSTRQLRLASAGSGYASQDGGRLYFGLAAAPRVDRLTVTWPGGMRESYADLPAGRLVRVTEGEGIELLALAPAAGAAPAAR